MALLERIAAQQQNSLSMLPEGVAGIRATLDAMIRAARSGATTLDIRQLAEQIISDVPPRDFAGELAAIQRWVSNNIRYTRDPVNAELLRDPVALIADRHGDCDDQATLVAALVMCIGFPARFVAIGLEQPGVFDHVFTEARLGTVWLSIETTEPVRVGWIPQDVKARIVRHI